MIIFCTVERSNPTQDSIIFADSGEPLRAVRLEKGDKGITAKEIWKATRRIAMSRFTFRPVTRLTRTGAIR